MSERRLQEQVRIYDLDSEEDWKEMEKLPGKFIRVNALYVCSFCGYETNRVFYVRTRGVRTACINLDQDWHKLIGQKEQLAKLPHPASYLAELLQEIGELKAVQKGKTPSDVVGEFTPSRIIPLTD